MTKKHGLRTIQTLAESTETTRSRAVSAQRRKLLEEERRLEQLESYRSEYQALSSRSDKAVCIHFVRGRRGFVEKLNDGIKNQRGVVARAREQLERHLAHWREARTKSLSLQKFADRLATEDSRRAARREQTEQDDIGRRTTR